METILKSRLISLRHSFNHSRGEYSKESWQYHDGIYTNRKRGDLFPEDTDCYLVKYPSVDQFILGDPIISMYQRWKPWTKRWHTIKASLDQWVWVHLPEAQESTSVNRTKWHAKTCNILWKLCDLVMIWIEHGTRFATYDCSQGT